MGRRLFGFIPTIVTTAIGTILVGSLLGYIGSAAVSSVIQDQGWFATSGESPEARAYMLALLGRDADSLTNLRPAQDVASQALAAQSTRGSAQQPKPLSLTYLGGGSNGRLSVQMYVYEVRLSDGSLEIYPLSLTLLGGKVIDRR